MPVIEKLISHPLVNGCPPSWASGWGQDKYGVWISFTLKDVVLRLRWVPPGSFFMGSPEDEAGRYDDEVLHRVTLSNGFWLFDTPVTQALWIAVMEENPSKFKSPKRPVESVTWDDCVRFMVRINEILPGLELRFPTEAEWEYACRCGTTTATYAGDLEIKGDNNAPVLDDIAWYGGNSGVDFELSDGEASSSWPEKQYDHKVAGTHPVALKRPNGLGLYDMLGNVLEWCADWYESYPDRKAIDPLGPDTGSSRVLRGGSWISSARNVRAAYRYSWTPDDRYYDLGFRCARGQ